MTENQIRTVVQQLLYDMQGLKTKVRELEDEVDRLKHNPVSHQETEELEGVPLSGLIIHYLQRIGVPSHIKGYKYIQKAATLVFEDHIYLQKMTKSLYPEIANSYGTTSSRVERAIRHAIEQAWKRGSATLFSQWLECPEHVFQQKPSNRLFITLLVDKIHQDRTGERVLYAEVNM
ncbi:MULTISPECIES: sporulation initiation factor Spo0A C-terminal domain-containing protein [Pontibacillus]|uniref:Sporulation initiation factor Spo0A C-terminal domain-containing protein n=1 Tax=Pontibacillus chungwhensis TaxID=265426 RepID=A0ABY8V183_9BACI|nr:MULTISPECIES: sporulation initiation factor Spo0A C-terminal domain-containing protein [Pontibacillus]MCD5322253.1 sporulation initiation factor Spo0A C-terminal domain-containing protein [Pontibacillus sp. HN14]WIF99547.1 sporulation initiation factor Spo0A C-terminal domain-containing protein [Pontibacillus chungwhensis]